MKIGVIADTHIPDKCEHIPETILNAFKHVDMVVHAGDMVDLGAIDELKVICPKIVAVAGNMDSQAVTKKFPVKQIFEISGRKVGIMHGYGAPSNLIKILKNAFKNEHPDVIIFGHSHKSMNEVIDGILFFNPGSATDHSLGYASYGIIEIKDKLQGHGLAIDAKIIKI
ncbi:MAG: metallophosphoesterase [Candidatus Omnitrophica bacterium]|nr:metallophosphoesterase [Candidatus Omnitrophota bacterium]